MPAKLSIIAPLNVADDLLVQRVGVELHGDAAADIRGIDNPHALNPFLGIGDQRRQPGEPTAGLLRRGLHGQCGHSDRVDVAIDLRGILVACKRLK